LKPGSRKEVSLPLPSEGEGSNSSAKSKIKSQKSKIEKLMKTKTIVATLTTIAVSCFVGSRANAQDVDSIAPVIVKTVPQAGTKNVAPGVTEIKVTFSKEMADQSWTWSTAWNNSCPDGVGAPHYEADHKTCVLKVKLEPNKTYGYWLNSQKFHGFKDSQGHSAVPYLLVFQTKAE